MKTKCPEPASVKLATSSASMEPTVADSSPNREILIPSVPCDFDPNVVPEQLSAPAVPVLEETTPIVDCSSRSTTVVHGSGPSSIANRPDGVSSAPIRPLPTPQRVLPEPAFRFPSLWCIACLPLPVSYRLYSLPSPVQTLAPIPLIPFQSNKIFCNKRFCV